MTRPIDVAIMAAGATISGSVTSVRASGSLSGGGSLVVTGHRGDRLRFDLTADLKLSRHYGALLAWRAFDDVRRGLVTAGLVYEAASARPRLVLDLYAAAGADLDEEAPVAGGGIRTTLMIYGPLAVVLDTSAHLVIDGVDDTRMQLASSMLLGFRW